MYSPNPLVSRNLRLIDNAATALLGLSSILEFLRQLGRDAIRVDTNTKQSSKSLLRSLAMLPSFSRFLDEVSV